MEGQHEGRKGGGKNKTFGRLEISGRGSTEEREKNEQEEKKAKKKRLGMKG